MGHLGSDGKPFDADEIKRLERALISLTDQVMQAVPGDLSVELLKKWHRVLAAGLERVQPGKFRRQDITFGSFTGTAPERIESELLALLVQQQAALPGFPLAEGQVVYHATWMHAELIRIHPFWDGNGRLARAVQAWLCWSYGLHAPRYHGRTAYVAGLNRYHHTRNMELLMQVTWQALEGV